MKKFKLRKTNVQLMYFIIVLFLELVFKFLTNSFEFNISLLYITLNSLIVSLALSFVTILFKNTKINKIISFLLVFLMCLIFAIEFCVFKMFGFYFDLSLLGAVDQVVSFADDGITLVLENILGVMFIFIPLMLMVTFNRKIVINGEKWGNCLIRLVLVIILTFILNLTYSFNKSDEYSAYVLYNEVNNMELTIKKMGILKALGIDLKRTMFGFTENIDIDIDNINSEEVEEKVYDYNNLDIDFDTLINETNDGTIKQMHEYFKNEKGTQQNEYTNFFAGKNLILFMAESFNEIAVDEIRTPTLYKLINNGFVFNNFYSPTISSTIGGEFQELTGLVASSGFITPWKNGNNSFPWGIGKIFSDNGYNTFAYHNHNYTFQNRYKYLSALGFTNFKGCGNGLEGLINCKVWPESDVEMIEATVSDYLASEKPFFTYYVTVSGHGDYGWSNTAMGRKHRDEVSDLPYSEKVLSYLAANIELDKALELLLEKLEESGKLDDTVIALVGDHYPYYLSLDEVNEVASYKKDEVVEINHSNFILWNSNMEKVEVEKVGSQIDVLPTLYNVFGINYDSRLIIGKDILSKEMGLAIFGNHSWVSDYGTYYSAKNEFVLKEGKEVDGDYVKTMNKIVANKMNMSKLILTEDYYKYIKWEK